MAQQLIRAVLYADWGSNLEFSDPEKSAIVREFRKTFGSRIQFTYASVEEIQDQSIFKKNPHLFILPGIKGEVSAFTARIGAAGNKNIKDFVLRGGLYFGVCAGAYYAGSSIHYQTAWGEARSRIAEEILDLAPVDTMGPIPGYCDPIRGASGNNGDSAPEGLSCVDPIPVIICGNTVQKRHIKMAYGLGPTFRIAASIQKDVDVLLRYDTGEKPPAIIHVKNIGLGAALLCGVLPQYGQESTPNKDAVSKRFFNLQSGLYESRTERNYVWNHLLMSRVWAHAKHYDLRLAA